MPPPQPVHPTEIRLRDDLAAALDNRTVTVVVHGAGDTIVRGEYLRHVLVQTSREPTNCITRLILWSTRVTGTLALEGVELKLTPSFIDCTFDSWISLTDAKAIGFELIGGTIPELRADRLTTTGSLLIRKALVDPAYHHTQPVAAPIQVSRSVLLSGARIHGNLDLRGCRLGATLTAGRDTICLLADGITVEGNLLLGDGLSATGEIRLNGCDILRNLDCSGATLNNPGGFSLSAAGGHVHGSVYLTLHGAQDFTSTGTFRLAGAVVDGDLDASAGRFIATAFTVANWTAPAGRREDLDALAANGLNVGAALRLRHGFVAQGTVSLIAARIGTDFSCERGNFYFPGEEALYADGITVNGATFITEGAVVNGLLRFVQANLLQGFFMQRAVLDTTGDFRDWLGSNNVSAEELGRNVCGIYASGAKFGGTFYFCNNTRNGPPGRTPLLSVQYATTNTLEDDVGSWQAVEKIDVRDCDYQTIVGVTDAIDWRVTRLDNQYIGPYAGIKHRRAAIAALFSPKDPRIVDASHRFAPQPYLKLAQVIRRAGYDTAANRVVIHLERNRTCFGAMSPGRQFARWTQDLVLAYGFSPFRPVIFLALWMAVSAVWFKYDYDHHWLVAAKPVAVVDPAAKPPAAPPPPQVRFNAVFYATDTLVPLVDLNQKKSFVFIQPSWLLYFNSFFGWTMTTFFAAGVSGLLRRGNDS